MAAASGSALVLVTGASGYIATHIVKQLQESGYKVRGTVRNLQDENKVKHLNNLCPDAKHKLELVEADLTKPETWEPAVKDAEFVIHVASPFPNVNPKDENEIIQPAVEGTLSVLKACVAAKTVKRVVLTSSCAAVSWASPVANPEQDKVFTEEDWSDPDKIEPYAKSKTLAEKAAWDFVKDLSESDRIELAVVNPAYVMGPVLHNTPCTSMEVMKRLLERSMPALPKLNFPIIDVRDVADAHIKAMITPQAAGKRHLITNVNMWMKEMAQIVNKEFKPQGKRHLVYGFSLWLKDMALLLAKEFDPQGYNVPTLNCPYFAVWMTSLFDKTVKMILSQIGIVLKYDNTRMKEVLEISPRDPKETLIDMAYSMIENGFIKKTKKYRGPGGMEAEEAEKKEDGKKDEEKKEEGKKEDKQEDEKKEEDGKKEEEAKEEKEQTEKGSGDGKTDDIKTNESKEEPQAGDGDVKTENK